VTLVQRSRFTRWLQNLTGFKGPFGVNLDGGITPVYDFSTSQPDLDEEVAYWAFPIAQGALAANFTSAWVKLAPQTGQQQLLRVMIDAIWVRAEVATSVVNVGMIAAPAAGGSSVFLRNNYLGLRGVTFGAAGLSVGAVQLGISQQAASLFVSPASTLQVDVPLAPHVGSGSQIPPFVVTTGWAFCLETQAVNLPLHGWVAGRIVADQL
jgi:hypothetical protein